MTVPSPYLCKLYDIQDEYKANNVYPRAQEEVMKLLTKYKTRDTFYISHGYSPSIRWYLVKRFKEDGLIAEGFAKVVDCYDEGVVHSDCVRVIIPERSNEKK